MHITPKTAISLTVSTARLRLLGDLSIVLRDLPMKVEADPRDFASTS